MRRRFRRWERVIVHVTVRDPACASSTASSVRSVWASSASVERTRPGTLVFSIRRRDRCEMADSRGRADRLWWRKRTGLRGMLIRLRPGGSLDSSFERIGVDHVCLVAALAVRPDNRILITGPQTGGAPEYCEVDVTTARARRLTPDGELDRAFGRRAQVKLAFPGAGDTSPAALAVDARGRILVAASSSRRGLAVARLTRRGAYDRRFGRDGRVTRRAGPFNRNLAEDIAADDRGNVFVVGTSYRRTRTRAVSSCSSSRAMALRTSPSHPRGIATPPYSVDSSGHGVAVTADGQAFAAGFATSSCSSSDDSCSAPSDVTGHSRAGTQRYSPWHLRHEARRVAHGRVAEGLELAGSTRRIRRDEWPTGTA